MSNSPILNILTGSVRRVKHTLRALLGIGFVAALAGCFAAEEEPAPEASPLLYEIVGTNGEVEGWMLGTIHLLPDGVAWRTKTIDRVVDEADILLVEIADLENSDAIAQVFVELGTTHGLPPLLDRVKPTERKALSAMIDRSGFSPEDFSAVETWAAALMLAQGNSLGSAQNGVDRAVLEAFKGREVREFEGALAQLTIFDQLAEEDQRVLLSSTVIDRDAAQKDARDLLNSWIKGDATAIERLTTTGALEDPEVRGALLVDRNSAWVGKLAAYLRTPEKPLVAVGAAHLVGPDGLPAMLEARGYTVRRIGAQRK